VVEHLLSIRKVLSLISSTEKTKQTKNNKGKPCSLWGKLEEGGEERVGLRKPTLLPISRRLLSLE
jgi:hypothetical protein